MFPRIWEPNVLNMRAYLLEPVEAEATMRRRVPQGWSANPATARKASLSFRAGRVKPRDTEIV